MLNLITVGNARINVDKVMHVTKTSVGNHVFVYLNVETDDPICLKGLSATNFLAWWDDIAINLDRYAETRAD